MHKHLKQQSRLWDYAINKKLGKGTSGQVFQVLNKNNQQLYALKKMSISGTQEKQKIQAFKEIKCLSLLSHPSIIQYKQSFLSMDNIYIVMEYASKGDFSQIVQERKKRQRFYKEDQLWDLFEQIIKGIKFLHQKNIIHRDLKLENIFMTEQGKVKIGDLGMAKILNKDNQLISTRVGTPVYFAPQMIQNQLYSFPVDIWSLGCVLYYLTTLEHPFQQASIQTLAYYAIDKGPKPIKGQYSVQLINFISSCLEKDVKSRPTIFQLALKLKNRNQQSNNKYNKISIFNLKHLNKILTASATEPKNCVKEQRKILSHRDMSFQIYSPRKIHTSLNQRTKIQTSRIENRNIKSSADNREFIKNRYLIESPQSPTLRKKFSNNDKQNTYCLRKMVGDDLKQINSPLIKTSGFSMHIVPKINSCDNFDEFQVYQKHQQTVFPLRKAISRRSHR